MHLISVISNVSVQPSNDRFIQDLTASAASVCTESCLSVHIQDIKSLQTSKQQA